MRLLGRMSSINVRKVVWTAAEIGLAYDHEVKWATPEALPTEAEFLRLNPFGLVPVWCDDLGAVRESNTICRYLATRHRREDLLPALPRPRAMVEQWMDLAAGDLNSAWRFPFMWLVRGDVRYDDLRLVERGIAGWNSHMEVLDRHLERHGPYMTGPDFTLADILIGLVAHRWRSTPMERPFLPALAEYLVRLDDRPAFAAVATPEFP